MNSIKIRMIFKIKMNSDNMIFMMLVNKMFKTNNINI